MSAESPLPLIVDERVGSSDLLPALQKCGVPAELGRLLYGDFAFLGRGLGGKDVHIGIELKETRDLIASLKSSRFSGHQLIGLQTDYDRAWLVTEGIWRAGDEGVLEVMHGGWAAVAIGKQRIMAADLEAWLLTQTIRGGINHQHCSTRKDTIRFISVLHKWWTGKAMEDHRSHEAIYLPPPDRASLVEPSTFVKMCACLPGVGFQKAVLLDAACGGSLKTLCDMSERDLQAVDGIGKKIAFNIRNALGGQ